MSIGYLRTIWQVSSTNKKGNSESVIGKSSPIDAQRKKPQTLYMFVFYVLSFTLPYTIVYQYSLTFIYSTFESISHFDLLIESFKMYLYYTRYDLCSSLVHIL